MGVTKNARDPPKTPVTAPDTTSKVSQKTAPKPSRKRTSVTSWHLPQSFVQRALSLPGQLLFALLGLLGIARWPRQIVRVRPRRPGTTPGLVEGSNIDSWIESNVPSLNGTFTPSWWLPNGHLQTAYIVLGNFSKVDQVDYVRTMLRIPDGGTLALDITPPNHAELPPDAPTIVVCHGLTGNARESYVRNLLNWAVKPKSEGGIGARGVVVNFRGCGGTPVTSPQLYSAAASCDLNTAAHYLRHTFPDSALHGVGFSLGASVLSRYLGERGDKSLLSSGMPIGCPWDVVHLSHALEDGWLSSRLYSRALAGNLLRLFFRHYLRNPKMWEESDRLKATVPEMKRLQKLGNAVRLKMVDDVFTSRAGGPHPPWPFKGAQEYYEYAGSHQLIHNIQVPTLGINAFDDPVVHGVALPISQVENSSHVHLAVTGGGGHLGWFDGPFFGDASKRRWVVKPMSEFLSAAARDLEPRASVVALRGPAPKWAGKPEPWQDGRLEGWEHEVVNGMGTSEDNDTSLDDDERSIVSEADEEAEVNADLSGSATPVRMSGEGWYWVQGPVVPPQTGARPARVGWKVLCRDVCTDKWSASGAPEIQGL